MAKKASGMLVKVGITVLVVVAALLMFGPLFAVVAGDEYRGSASLDLGRGDRVTILTTVPDPSQAPECRATGPGGAAMIPSTNQDVFDINGVRYYPTVEFTAGGDGRFQVECANGALFKADVTTAGFSLGNLLKSGIPAPVILGVVAVAIALILFMRRSRGRRTDAGADRPIRANGAVAPSSDAAKSPAGQDDAGPDAAAQKPVEQKPAEPSA